MTSINILVASHGHFAEELVASAEMIIGKVERVEVISLLPEMSFDDFLKTAESILKRNDGKTIALVDLFGGTPSNVLTALTKKYNLEVITGASLCIFIDLYMKVSGEQEINIEELVDETIKIANEGTVHTNKKLD